MIHRDGWIINDAKSFRPQKRRCFSCLFAGSARFRVQMIHLNRQFHPGARVGEERRGMLFFCLFLKNRHTGS
jgi:hypothetical protein